jgi:molybdopterin-biosynthesis enzyme MoeA-like protein
MVWFLQRCKELPTEGRSEAELQEQLEKLKKELETHINAYIKALLAQA